VRDLARRDLGKGAPGPHRWRFAYDTPCSLTHISTGTLDGACWSAQVLPLAPGQSDTLQFTFAHPGLRLFHCHVVSHADAGMIGIFNITEATP